MVHLELPLLPAVANSLWWLLSWPESRRFHLATQDVAATQSRVLEARLRQNAGTVFGRTHSFAHIRSSDEYRRRVPLSISDDYAQVIGRIGDGDAGLLTSEPVRRLEPTSGSTAATKLIPYTASLQAEFQAAIAAWIADAFRHMPALIAGTAYWSLSPVARRNERTPGGIPVGFNQDSEYLGGVQRRLVDAVMAVPSAVRLIDDMATFRYMTLLFLLRSRNLRLVSVWNPTFLLLLLDALPGSARQLAEDIARGTLSPPGPLAPDLRARFAALNRADARRGQEIGAAISASATPAKLHARLWPHLRLISCWADANAMPYAAALYQQFPNVVIQPKGLVATEAFVSLPLAGHDGAALAVRSHFFEFAPVGDDPCTEVDGQASTKLAHELDVGAHYSVIVTTGGGLYRYRLHDLVRVTGKVAECPLLRFVGKEAMVVDHFGEKLNERHVSTACAQARAAHGISPTFCLVAFDRDARPPAYTLFIEAEVSPALLQAMGRSLEERLLDNYHYRYCRELGQLGPLRLFHIQSRGLQTYIDHCAAHGQRAGDVKPLALHRLDDWATAFHGEYLTGD